MSDVIIETTGNAANEHRVLQSPHEWLPEGATVYLEPATTGYMNTMLHDGTRYGIHNVRVIDGSEPERTRTALEIDR